MTIAAKSVMAAFGGLLVLGFSPVDVLRTGPAAHNERGRGHYEHRRHGRAGDEFDEAIAGDPESADLLYNRATTQYKRRDYQAALRTLDQVLQHPQAESRLAQRSHYNAGNAHFKLRDYDGAIASYEESLKLKPGDPDTLHNLELAKKAKEREEQEQRSECQNPECESDSCQGGCESGGGGEEGPPEKESQGKAQEQRPDGSPSPPFSGRVTPPPPAGREYGPMDSDEVERRLEDHERREKRMRSYFDPDPAEGGGSLFDDHPFGPGLPDFFGDPFGDPFEEDAPSNERDW